MHIHCMHASTNTHIHIHTCTYVHACTFITHADTAYEWTPLSAAFENNLHTKGRATKPLKEVGPSVPYKETSTFIAKYM